jgi:hypothetical protein
MMLTRVISIKNVGRFRNSAHTPNVGIRPTHSSGQGSACPSGRIHDASAVRIIRARSELR